MKLTIERISRTAKKLQIFSSFTKSKIKISSIFSVKFLDEDKYFRVESLDYMIDCTEICLAEYGHWVKYLNRSDDDISKLIGSSLNIVDCEDLIGRLKKSNSYC